MTTNFYQLGSEIKFFGLFDWDDPEIKIIGVSDRRF